MWVSGRQYTGRIVTITNDKVFDTPVYNYTREFPFLWDEIRVPIRYSEDAHRAEEIALRAAADATAQIVSEARPAMEALLQAFPVIERIDIEPRVYVRLTDNWIELTVRFLARQRGVREVKNAISRQILRDLTAAGMAIASSTMDVTVKSA
jgi:small-conductance mechanosensitive channel